LNNQIFKLIIDEEQLADDIYKAKEIKELLTIIITYVTQVLDTLYNSTPVNT